MQYCRIELFSVIDPFHPGRYRGKNLIGNRTQPTGHLFYGQLLAEYLDTVSFPTIDVGYIYQGYVHTDITDDRSTLAIDDDTPFAIAEMPVKPIREGRSNTPRRLYPTVSPAAKSRICKIVVFNVLTVRKPLLSPYGETP